MRPIFAPGLVLLLALLTSSAFAYDPGVELKDANQEERARELFRELRCMVCQNQSIDDSDAPLARDLRVLVRERLKAGDSNKDVIDFLTVRYGDFVLLRPRFTLSTALLWIMPAVFVGAGVISLLVLLRRRRIEAPAEPQLTPAEQARLAEVIERNE